MTRPVGTSAQFDVPAAFEHAVENGLGAIRVVQHARPCRQELVGGEDHRAVMQIAIVDHLEEHVRGVRAVAEIADLIDGQDAAVFRGPLSTPNLSG